MQHDQLEREYQEAAVGLFVNSNKLRRVREIQGGGYVYGKCETPKNDKQRL